MVMSPEGYIREALERKGKEAARLLEAGPEGFAKGTAETGGRIAKAFWDQPWFKVALGVGGFGIIAYLAQTAKVFKRRPKSNPRKSFRK